MAKKKAQKDTGSINVDFQGSNTGAFVVGSGNTVTSTVTQGQAAAPDLSELERLLAALREEIAREAPPAQKPEALSRVAELEKAVKKPTPANLSTMEYVGNWFKENLPKMAGSVSTLVLSPVVRKLVETAGSAVSQEFVRRFGG